MVIFNCVQKALMMNELHKKVNIHMQEMQFPNLSVKNNLSQADMPLKSINDDFYYEFQCIPFKNFS